MENAISKGNQKDIDRAASLLVKDKFCFGCATWRPKENGSLIKKGTQTRWKCFHCQKKLRF